MVKAQKLGAFGLAAMAAVLTVGFKRSRRPRTLIQAKLSLKSRSQSPPRSLGYCYAGDVVVLQKTADDVSSSSSYAFSNTIGGVLAANYNNRAKDPQSLSSKASPVRRRSSVTDQQKRLRIAQVRCRREVLDHGIASRKTVSWSDLQRSLSDRKAIRFVTRRNQVPLQKGSVPPPDDFAKTFSELITVQLPTTAARVAKRSRRSSGPSPAAAPAPAPAPIRILRRRLHPPMRRHNNRYRQTRDQ